MRSPSMKRSLPERSMARTNDNIENSWDLWLMLLQSLYHCDQYLDLLHQGSKQVLLGHQWWRWWSKRLYLQTAPFILTREISGVAGGGVLAHGVTTIMLQTLRTLKTCLLLPTWCANCYYQIALHWTPTVAEGALLWVELGAAPGGSQIETQKSIPLTSVTSGRPFDAQVKEWEKRCYNSRR